MAAPVRRFASFAAFLTRMATLDPTVAGLASVHGCIGAVDPVRTFGNAEQKQRFLPRLASGERLSAFALTEPAPAPISRHCGRPPCRDGDELRRQRREAVHHQRRARPHDRPGLLDRKQAGGADRRSAQRRERPLPTAKSTVCYALKHTYNHGIIFNDFRVPAENLLMPTRGDGLTIAYHGLNLGRVALCANAAGTMR